VREGIHKTDAQYASDLIEFAKQSPLKAAPQVMLKQGTTGFSQELLMHGMWITENKDEDETVVAGIRIVSNAFRQRRLRIHKSCTNTIREHQMYCWNPNKLAEGTEQPLKHHNFTCDALRRVAAEIFQYSGRLEMKAA
jgi:phage terminase large subunit